ncbi:hypothetical protein [Pseudarthrobacter sp. DSP2-3-2b1]|uniref:hypothetical protein n=1 Tax=Pseudarthrobacter sp. DSP2-3-2b1 TaxID=2804661 RepID=UPI003CFB743D
MGEENKKDRGDERTLLERLQVIGQQGEVLAFMRNMRLEQQSRGPVEKIALVMGQYEREREQILQWLGKTEDPQWWAGASEKDVFEVFGVSSTWKDDSEAAAEADRRIRQAIQHKYGVDAPSLDTMPPWDEDRRTGN